MKKSALLLFISILFISCNEKYKFKLTTPKKLNVTQDLIISFADKNNKPIDSVHFAIDNKSIKLDANFKATVNISNYKLGRHTVSALVFYANKSKKLNNTVYFLADEKPSIYNYKIINSYPHDRHAYTQGLEFHDGFLYESTGKNGTSSLRKVELKTGKVVQQIDLDNKYFGEGMTKLGDQIFMLTWQKGIGFIYDFESFEQKGTFKYKNSIQGWGLTNDGEHLIKTDGTERIWFLNAKTQAEEKFIEAYTNERKVENLNELEYIDGKIYANIYQRNSILIVNPKTGKVEGVADLNGLKTEMEKTQKLVPQDEVLNGIAYDKETNRLFVTGKNWGKLFEIELIKKN
ncbi:MAG: glutamine cyclotransferase [Flavobacteriaceae bacterium]|nr:MAG: glutamine cyclotransferase [Flavobacteriaceae bacterium]